MKIEQIQYFVEVAQKGSISAAAKHLFMSPQGVSDAIHQLEKYIGFPLFIRQNRGVYLTPNGEVFFEKAQLLLNSYQETLHCAQRLEFEYNRTNQKQTLLVNPIFASAVIDILIQFKLIDHFQIYESEISSSISSLQNHLSALAIMTIASSDISTFEKGLPNNLVAVELFEDEYGVCTFSDSTYRCLEAIDEHDSNILFIAHPSSYNEYFNNTLTCTSTIQSSDILSHLKMMRENNAVCICTRKLMHLTYPDENALVFIPFSQKHTGKFFLVYNKALADRQSIINIKKIIDTIRQVVENK